MSHPLLARLASREPAERIRACRAVALDPAGVVLLPALAEVLGDASPQVAMAAADAVAAIGARAGGVDSLLARHLRDERENARWAAAFASALLLPPSPRLLPPLVEALDCAAREVRWRAARLLVRCAAVLPEVLPLLRGLATGDPRTSVRRMSLHCLREIAPGEFETEAAALVASHDACAEVRRAALAALAGLALPALAVGERLTEMAQTDSDLACRSFAVAALADFATRPRGPAPAAIVALLRRAAAECAAPGPRAAAARAVRWLEQQSAGAAAAPTA